MIFSRWPTFLKLTCWGVVQIRHLWRGIPHNLGNRGEANNLCIVFAEGFGSRGFAAAPRELLVVLLRDFDARLAGGLELKE